MYFSAFHQKKSFLSHDKFIRGSHDNWFLLLSPNLSFPIKNNSGLVHSADRFDK